MSPGPGLFLRWEVCDGGSNLVPMYDTSTVSPDTNVLMVYARGDDENTYRTSSAYWSLLVQVPEAQKRRELYCALRTRRRWRRPRSTSRWAARYGRGIARYRIPRKYWTGVPSSGSGSRRKKRYCINSCGRQTGRFGRLGNNWHCVGNSGSCPADGAGYPGSRGPPDSRTKT